MLLTHYWNCSVGAGLLYSELIPFWKSLDWFTLAEATAFLFLSCEQRARKILYAWIVRTASLQFWCNLLDQWDDDNTLHQLWPKDPLLASKLLSTKYLSDCPKCREKNVTRTIQCSDHQFSTRSRYSMKIWTTHLMHVLHYFTLQGSPSQYSVIENALHTLRISIRKGQTSIVDTNICFKIWICLRGSQSQSKFSCWCPNHHQKDIWVCTAMGHGNVLQLFIIHITSIIVLYQTGSTEVLFPLNGNACTDLKCKKCFENPARSYLMRVLLFLLFLLNK